MNVVHEFLKLLVCRNQVVYCFTGVEYSGMVAISNLRTDIGQRGLGEFLSEKHSQLSRLYNMSFSGFGL